MNAFKSTDSIIFSCAPKFGLIQHNWISHVIESIGLKMLMDQACLINHVYM